MVLEGRVLVYMVLIMTDNGLGGALKGVCSVDHGMVFNR